MSRRMMLVPVLLALVAALVGLLLGCSGTPDPWPANRPGPKVLASFAPIHCFALNVAGDDAVVLPIMTDRGPHGFQGTAQDALKLKRADLFLINGLGLDDDIADRLQKSSRNAGLKVVRLGEAIPPDRRLEGGYCYDPDEEAGGHLHKHGKDDAHVWLGIPEAIIMVDKIAEELKQRDPDHASGYEQRARAYAEKLRALEAEGKAMLQPKTERQLITFHNYLGYFARTFGLKIIGTIEQTPGQDPSPMQTTDLVRLCREKNVRLIAVEPQYPSNTSAAALRTALKAKGAEAEFIKLDPIETCPAGDLTADYYERKMRENLQNLAAQLK